MTFVRQKRGNLMKPNGNHFFHKYQSRQQQKVWVCFEGDYSRINILNMSGKYSLTKNHNIWLTFYIVVVVLSP